MSTAVVLRWFQQVAESCRTVSMLILFSQNHEILVNQTIVCLSHGKGMRGICMCQLFKVSHLYDFFKKRKKIKLALIFAC